MPGVSGVRAGLRAAPASAAAAAAAGVRSAPAGLRLHDRAARAGRRARDVRGPLPPRGWQAPAKAAGGEFPDRRAGDTEVRPGRRRAHQPNGDGAGDGRGGAQPLAVGAGTVRGEDGRRRRRHHHRQRAPGRVVAFAERGLPGGAGGAGGVPKNSRGHEPVPDAAAPSVYSIVQRGSVHGAGGLRGHGQALRAGAGPPEAAAHVAVPGQERRRVARLPGVRPHVCAACG
mmetsp:Transcript_61076/g.164722  ORF Transcript_61076/g.164722 Transcript_61076/m.164722 type:complete len:229 (+) Transcript_61076:870-1556(+)